MLKKPFFCMSMAFCAFFVAEDSMARPDDHAPIGLMGEHTHNAGEWMTSYRYSQMSMKGNRNGDDEVSVDAVLEDFAVAPTKMTMEMHMFGLMRGVTDRLTVMGTLPYVRKKMEHETSMTRFSTETDGIGDVKLMGLYRFYDEKNEALERNMHATLGLSLPTGAIDEMGATPMGHVRLPYPMQLGSGTYDPILGLTYWEKRSAWSWGAQANTIVRFGENDEGYRLGHEYEFNSWIAQQLHEGVSISFRVKGQSWGNIKGEDNQLNPAMAPTARADLRGGKRVDALVGLNLIGTQAPIRGQRLALELGAPIYQHLDGPQLEAEYNLTLGWQFSF